ncbi:DUF1353 domain-containing protein [Pseudomonas rhizoryzae]|uniref:DUF1353 domain-containing protein n=1 Tax=Pseudomonas rhizoryzae TaxID=2571129 RepID=UPI0010C185EC|nr:DUF1353 domain-containing protein [Pseudomonas rhizoryzae]
MTPAVGKFDNGVALRQIERYRFRLLEPLVFNDPLHGLLAVPVDFESDLASVRVLREICRWSAIVAVLAALLLSATPWVLSLSLLVALAALVLYGLVVGYGMRAAILHDWLYSTGLLSRAEADAVLYRALHAGDGVAAWRAWLFWSGVRIGGAGHYGTA